MYKTPQQAYKELVKSNDFNIKGFLSSFFINSTPENFKKEDWQIHFYNSDSDKLTTYVVGEKILVLGESEVFKDNKDPIEELNLDKVKITLEYAIKKGELILKDNNETPTKIIIMLQKQVIPLWNITYVTEKFNMINIKINAENGELILNNTISLLSFGKVDGMGMGAKN